MNADVLSLEANERVLAVVHRHWLTLALRLFSITIFALFPLVTWIIVLIGAGLTPTLPYDLTQYTPHFAVLYANWLVYIIIILGQTLLNHHLDVWVVTSDRIVSVDQQGFFSRSTGSFQLRRLRDVNVEVRGILPTLLNYGTIEIETASDGPSEFRAHHIPRPLELKEIIMAANTAVTAGEY